MARAGTDHRAYPPRGARRHRGKAEILTAFRELFVRFGSFDSELTGVWPSAHDDAVCVPYRNRARLVDGTVHANDNIAVFRFQDGLISVYHDDFDPRRFQTVIDALRRT